MGTHVQEGAGGAAGSRATVRLPQPHHQGMEPTMVFDPVRELGSQLSGRRFVVTRHGMSESPQDPAGVGVHHRRRVTGRIEEDGVGRLLSHALEGEQAPSQRSQGACQEGLHGSRLSEDLGRHELKPPGLRAIEARGADACLDASEGGAGEGLRREQPFRLQGRQGPLDTSPAGLLRQQGADHDFPRACRLPPVLATEGLAEPFVDPEEVHGRDEACVG